MSRLPIALVVGLGVLWGSAPALAQRRPASCEVVGQNLCVRDVIAAVDRAFADFKAEGITELVLDVRYNGGGLVDVARHLASLIAAPRAERQIFAEFKPVGQYPNPFCDMVLAPVAFTLRNAQGEGDFFGGFAPDCAAVDDPNELGDVGEASLGEALRFIATGACSAPCSSSQRSDGRRLRTRAIGWQSVVNAY